MSDSSRDCSEIAEDVSAHVDGELSDEPRQIVEAHLETCADCRARAEGLRALAHRIGEKTGRRSPPEAVRARIESMQFEGDGTVDGERSTRHRHMVWRTAIAIAGIVLAIIATGWGLGVVPLQGRGTSESNNALDAFASQLVTDHEHSIPEKMPVEVASSDPDRVRRFFEGRVDFEPVVPVLERAELLGGRLCSIRNRHVELLFYEVGDRTMSVYVSDQPTTSEQCRHQDEHALCFVHRGDYEFILVGAMSTRKLKHYADSLTSKPP